MKQIYFCISYLSMRCSNMLDEEVHVAGSLGRIPLPQLPDMPESSDCMSHVAVSLSEVCLWVSV